MRGHACEGWVLTGERDEDSVRRFTCAGSYKIYRMSVGVNDASMNGRRDSLENRCG